MTDINEQFFSAYWRPGMKAVYTDETPKEMMVSTVDKEGWYEWKLIKGTLTNDDYRVIENKFNIKFPANFITWHKLYFFEDGDCSLVRLPCSMPTQPLQEIIKNLDWAIPKQLIPLGLIPFADEGNDTGLLVFDARDQNDTLDFPIRVYDHECDGDLDGLSEIIFSSFTKLIECITHFVTETTTKDGFKVIQDFYAIDPTGAGLTGKSYWTTWAEMMKANFEECGY